MSIFYPSVYRQSILEITPELLRDMGVRCVILDVDNTLQEHHAGSPAQGVQDWLDLMKSEGFALCIASNSKEYRVRPFAEKVGLPFEALCCKPFPCGLRRSARSMGFPKKECVMVGDQIFTDLIAAKTAGMKMILLSPIKPENGRSFRIRRGLERGIIRRYREKMK